MDTLIDTEFSSQLDTAGKDLIEELSDTLNLPELKEFRFEIEFKEYSEGFAVEVDKKQITFRKDYSSLYTPFEIAFGEDSPQKIKIIDELEDLSIRFDHPDINIKKQLLSNIKYILNHKGLVKISWFTIFSGLFNKLPRSVEENIFEIVFKKYLSPKFYKLYLEISRDSIVHEVIHVFVAKSISNNFNKYLLTPEEQEAVYAALESSVEYKSRWKERIDKIVAEEDKLLQVKGFIEFNKVNIMDIVRLLPTSLRGKFLFFVQYRAFNENITRVITEKFFQGEDQNYGGDYYSYKKGYYYYSEVVPGITKIRNALGENDPKLWSDYINDICFVIEAHTKAILENL